jgi:hypothetical protein
VYFITCAVQQLAVEQEQHLFPLLSLSYLPYSLASDLFGNLHIALRNFVSVHVFQIKFLGRWRGWLRHCATSRKVAGSVLNGVTGTFHWHNPSGCIMALGSTQTLKKWGPGIFPGGKGGRCVGLTTLPPACADCLEIWEPEHPGILSVRPGLYRNCLTFYITCGVEEWNVSMAHWRNATEGEKPRKGSEKKRISLHQNDVLYMLLLKHRMTSYIC